MVLRRLAAILLLAVFGLPLALASVAMGQTAGLGLPACCRRTGAHQCGMSMGERAVVAAALPTDKRWGAPASQCPYGPAAVTVVHVDPLLSCGSAETLLPLVKGPATRIREAECWGRIALDGARGKRGPPAVSLA